MTTTKAEWNRNEWVFATQNKHKVSELNSIFREQLGIKVVGLHSFKGLPEIIEDQDTFEGNARKKAETISQVLGRPVFADDSGLSVDFLNGAPGVYSARYAGLGATDEQNVEKLLYELKGVSQDKRGASFVCVLALSVPGEKTFIVRGECPGRIAFHPQGEYGFGYDPVFFLPDRGCTMAELPPHVKNQISHRAHATERLIHLLNEKFDFDQKSLSKE
ncbi:XTP/dITP diphosphatase [Melghirimyces algeriensis]|uniref:dITP/XTP pyrophosphatase n=1 Tax=Melghirimyces algeriensis TaxID=910412 RepID=A0A521APF7_9BACL|nr:XTP/dITP diphosphatase [Melghirimyces algeriensis]SMO36651.1 XTP/dITP diphosphohydrolase [Melghirimyces algeriensis]